MTKLNLRHVYTVLFLFFLSSTASAQDEMSYDLDQFQLIKSSGNLVYTFNKFEGYDKYELILYSPEGKLQNRLEFVSKTPLEILEVADIGEHTVFHMSGNEGFRLLLLDEYGEEQASKLLTFDDKVRDIDMVVNNSGISIISEVKRKKVGVGIYVQHFNPELTPKWTYEKFPEKGKYFIYDAEVSNAGTTALLYKNGNSDDYGICLLDPSGTELAFADVDEQGLSEFTPYYMSFIADDEILLVSDFGSTSAETFKGIPIGMNIMKLSASSGNMFSTSTVTFNDVQEQVGDKFDNGKPIYQVGPALRVLDVQDVQGEPTLICESYIFKERSFTKPTSSTNSVASTTYYKQLQLLDFYLLKVNSPKENIHRIWKPARAVEVEASSFTSAEGLCDIFAYNGFFSYQGMHDNKLLTRGFGQMHNYYCTINLADAYESILSRQYWGEPLNCPPSARPVFQSYNKPFGSSFLSKDLANTGILKTNNGYLLFEYNTTTDKITLKPIGTSSTVAAEDIKEINRINPSQIVGVYDMGMQSAVLSREGNRSIDQNDIYSLRFLNTADPIQEIVVDQNSGFYGTETSAEANLLIFTSDQQIDLIYIKPTDVPNKVVIPAKDRFSFGRIYSSTMSDKGVLSLVRSYSKLGFDRNNRDSVIESGSEYITLTKTGDIASRRYAPYVEGEPTFNLVSVYPTNNGMVYLMEHNGRKKQSYQLRMDICDGDGNVTGSHLLSGEQTHFPSEIISDNGNIFVSGYYLNGNIYTSKKTEGLFTKILKSDGSEINANLYNWDNLKSKLRDTKRAEFVFNGKMRMLIEHTTRTENGYRIICESYTSGSGTTTAEFFLGGNTADEFVITVHDFVVFETNNTGEIVNIEIIEKELSNIEVGGRAKRLPELQLVSMLKKHQVFPFKDVNDNMIHFVQYKNNEGFYAELDISTGTITEGTKILLEPVIEEEVDEDYEKLKANNKTINKLDRFSQKMDNFEKKVDQVGNKVAYGLEKIDRRFNPYQRSDSGFYFLDDDKVISYLINDQTYTVYYGFIN